MSRCTCKAWWARQESPGYHESGCPCLEGRRGVTTEEHRLLQHVTMFGKSGWPVSKLGRGWVWGTAGAPGPPVLFKTKRAAGESFEAFYSELVDALAGRV